MRFALVILAAALAAFAQPTTPAGRPAFNPPAQRPDFKGWDAAPAIPDSPITNAKRFEQGLPPLKPKSRRHRGHTGHLPGTRVRSAPRAETSPTPPVSVSCNIQATYTNGTAYGFVSPVWNEFGEYYAFQDTQDSALLVSFSYPADSPGTPSRITLTAKNGPSSLYPYFGGVVGFGSDGNNLGPGYNYAYLAGTTETPAGSPAVAGPNSFTDASGIDESIQSAIWVYSSYFGDLIPQWVNDDGKEPTTHIVYVQGVLALTGDPLAVNDAFGPAEILKFKCVPPIASP